MNTLETMRPLSESIAALVLEKTDEAGISQQNEQFPIFPGEEIRIGRDADKCFPVIHSNMVSKQHFRIYNIIYDDEQDPNSPPLIYCEDLESVNGTWVNDFLIGIIGSPRKGYLLGNGDLIQIKPHWAFRFHQNLSKMDIVMDDVQEAETQHFADRYTIERRVLGSGLSGRVHLAFDNLTRTQLACKVVDLRPLTAESMRDEVSPEFVKPPLPRNYNQKSHAARELSRLMREIDILSKLNHPNIVSLKKAFRSENTIYLFQELATGGDLFSYLQGQGGKLNDLHSRIITRQVALAIQYIHSQGIAHRDLKPENILVTNTDIGHRVLLTDFGSSALIANSPTRLLSLVGTEGYAAPEVKRTRMKNEGYTKAIDMWSLGIVATCLLTGDLLVPQNEQSQHESENDMISVALSRNINKMLEARGQWEDVEVRARDFVKRLLVPNAEDRMTADQAVHHYWFTRPKEVAREIEQLYERANKHWRPRQEINILEELREIPMTSSAERTDDENVKKPRKRQKRLPDVSASAYHTLNRHLHPKVRSKRQEILDMFKKNSSRKFMPDISQSTPRADAIVPTTRSMRVHGNDLFGPNSQIDAEELTELEVDGSEPEIQIASHTTPDDYTSGSLENMADSRVFDETWDSSQEDQEQQATIHPSEGLPDSEGFEDIQDRQPELQSPQSTIYRPEGMTDAEDPEDSEEVQDTQDHIQDRQPDDFTSEAPKDLEIVEETQDGQEMLHGQEVINQKDQEPRTLLERQRGISDPWTQEDQQVFEKAFQKIPPFSSAKLLRQKIAEERERS